MGGFRLCGSALRQFDGPLRSVDQNGPVMDHEILSKFARVEQELFSV